MIDYQGIHQLVREAPEVLRVALHAGEPEPPPPRGPKARTTARNWSIVLGRLRDGRTLRALGEEHGGLSVERVRQIVVGTAFRWALIHAPDFAARYRALHGE